ncbi:DgyrCDS6229 [Dimorphilus gyrociliatus]|uniref:DgyrCDS6229 n=1 Tax=Dimorphilus gyrociliatus TaxID=2664684 RepID=A0A7I8VN80_9ANNE|nr:DgyrCDS6229 [Dimorphilus gyrociliatus]
MLGIWREYQETSTIYRFRRIHKVTIPQSTENGTVTLLPDFPLPVEKGDVIGFDYAAASDKNTIAAQLYDSGLPEIYEAFKWNNVFTKSLRVSNKRDAVKTGAYLRYFAIQTNFTSKGLAKKSPICFNKDIYTVGRALNLGGSGGELLNMLVDFYFPCDGHILSLKYYRVISTSYSFVGIWEPIDGISKYKLIYKIKLPVANKGFQTITLNKPLPIKANYIIAFQHLKNGPHVVSNKAHCSSCHTSRRCVLPSQSITVGMILDMEKCKNHDSLLRNYSMSFEVSPAEKYVGGLCFILLLLRIDELIYDQLQSSRGKKTRGRLHRFIFVISALIEITDSTIDPGQTVLSYLRDNLHLTGSKSACGEGGCGACTVMVSAIDEEKNEINHYSINACISPILSFDGLAITTVEGIGNVKTGVHPIQERIAKAHGIQCGFCTPGFNEDIEDLYKSDKSKFSCKKLYDSNEWKAYNPDDDETIPKNLLLRKNRKELNYTMNGRIWIKAQSMNHLATLKKKMPHASIIAGSTEISIDRLLNKGKIGDTFIHAPHYLNKDIQDNGEFLKIGSTATLSDLEKFIMEKIKPFSIFEALEESIKHFGSRQIRNVATISGNVYTSSPISDIMPILMASRSSISLLSTKKERNILLDDNFIVGYRKNVIKPYEVINYFKIPINKETQFIRFFKQAKRKHDDITTVCACYFLELTADNRIKTIRMVYGGIAPKTTEVTETTNDLIGMKWDRIMLEQASIKLMKELYISKGSPGGGETYRNNLILSLFFKFYLDVCQMLNKENIEKIYEPITGASLYDTIPEKLAVGKPLPIPSALKHATGQSEFIADMPKFKNEVIVYPILATISPAKFQIENIQEALKLPGVVDIISYDNWDYVDSSFQQWSVGLESKECLIANEETLYSGQPILYIVAENMGQALEAARTVKIDYQLSTDPIVTIDDAIRKNSFHKVSFDPEVNFGDVEAAFATSSLIGEGEINTGKQEHFYMETQSALAVPKDGDALDVYSSTQSIGLDHFLISSILKKPQHLINVICARCGGGFGGKDFQSPLTSVPASLIADKLKRPTRYVMDRMTDMKVTGGRNPVKAKYKIAYNDSGRIKALKVEAYFNAGYSMDCSFGVARKFLKAVGGGYNIPNMYVSCKFCKTNIGSATAFRGFGTPQAGIVTETAIDSVADVLNIPSESIREINMLKDGERTKLVGYESLTTMRHDSLRKCWLEMMQSYGIEDRREAIEKFNKENRWKKKGICSTLVEHYVGFNKATMNQGNALINIYLDGSVYLSFSGVEMGQGLNAKMQQVTSTALGVDYDRIYIPDASSYTIPNITTTAASCGTDVNGFAVLDACRQINSRLSEIKKNNPNISWDDMIKEAYNQQINLSASGHHKFDNFQDLNLKDNTGCDGLYVVWGTACSEVEIDCLTGDLIVKQADIVIDVGKSINPGIDIGQIEGAFIQGLGMMLLEEQLYDPSTSKLISVGPGKYKLPSIGNIPRTFNVTLLRDGDDSEPRAIHSSKGVGEPSLTLAVSALLAVKKAIKSARQDAGFNESFTINTPATPSIIRNLCRDEFTERVKKEIETRNEKLKKEWCVRV